MAHTFDIRFARSGGIAALFDAAGNSFGWKGGGWLSIDAQGMSFAPKRNIVSLLARRRSQRIPAEKIKEIYREGDALRVEFATEENPRTVLPFWARDRDTAAQIVQLLPTSRTFELEHTTHQSDEGNGKRMPLLLGAAVILVCGALFIGFNRPAAVNIPTAPIMAATSADAPVTAVAEISPSNQETAVAPRPASLASPGEPITPEQARLLAILAEDPVDWTSPPPGKSVALPSNRHRAPADPAPAAAEPEVEDFVPALPEFRLRGDEVIVPIPQTRLAYDTARELLRVFEADAADLTKAYGRDRANFGNGSLSGKDFLARLDWYEKRWRNLGVRVLDGKEYSDPALTGLRATLLAVVSNQRSFLSGYAAGLRTSDQAAIDRAFEDLARAGEMLERARRYVN